MTIDISAAPYFDDFQENKNYLKVLFKPGYAVQARELTQLQTSIQNQLSKLGNHIFQDGSIVLGGNTNIYRSSYILVNAIGNINNLFDCQITGSVSGARAKVSTVEQIGDTFRVFLLYISSAKFSQAETIVTSFGDTFTVLDNETFTGELQLFSIEDSTFYIKGHFVFCEKQSVPVLYRNAKLGIAITEAIIDTDTDETLLDPAQGSYNYAAPGADRYTIQVDLTSIEYFPENQQETTGNFVELARVENGHIVSRISNSSYADLEVNMARRTYDESGDYTVRAFGLKVKPHIFNDETKLSLAIDPGKAYIKGFEFETIATNHLDINKARDLSGINNTIMNVGFGSYLLIEAPTGTSPLLVHDHPEISFHGQTGGAGDSLGTANCDSISYYSPGVFKLALVNVYLSTSASFADIKSITSGNDIVANISINSYPNGIVSLIVNNSKSYILPFPNSNIHSLITRTIPAIQSDTEFVSYRAFESVTFNFTNSVSYVTTITLNAPGNVESFTSSDPRDFLIVRSDGSTTFPTIVSSGSATSRTLYHSENLGSNNVIYTTIGTTKAVQRNKTLTLELLEDVSIRNSDTSIITDKIYLGVADCHKIISILATSSVVPTTIPLDVTSYFQFNNGQKDDIYDYGWIQIKSGFNIPATFDTIDVQFSYFAHSGYNGFFSVDSYNFDDVSYDEIPTYISSKGLTYNLHSCLDYRLVRAPNNGGLYSSDGVVLNSTVSAEYDYYLSRIDKLVLTKERKFSLIRGVPSETPREPTDLIDAMTLYTINVPAYTPNENSISFVYHDNRRFTMRDIGKIEKRVGRLEYYTTLSYLEKQANDELIPSETPGVERFKNGILVDSFAGHSVGNVSNPDYKCSIDKNNRLLRPKFSSQSFLYDIGTLTPDVLTHEGDLIHLDYDTSLLIENPYATNWVNANPYMIFQWNGMVTLNPATDNWVDTHKKPDVTVNLNGENDVYTVLNQDADNTNSTGVLWNDWQSVIKGAVTGLDDEYNIENNTSTVVDPTTGGQTVTNTSTITNIQTTTTTDIDLRTGIEILKSDTRVNTRDIGTKVVDTSIVPYIRSRVVDFEAKHLKPETQLYATLDGVNITDYCTPAIKIVLTLDPGVTDIRNISRISFGNPITSSALILAVNKNEIFIKYEKTSSLVFATGNQVHGYIKNTISQNDEWTLVGLIGTISEIVITSELQSDIKGNVAGSFLIPDPNVEGNPKFRTGELLFKLTDTLSINANTAAEVKYVTQGLSQSTERTLVATRVASATVKPVTNLQSTSQTSKESIVIGDVVSTVQIPPPPEPITIQLDETYYGDGRVGTWQYFINYGDTVQTDKKAGIKISNPTGVPVKYTLTWDGKEYTTGFVGLDNNTPIGVDSTSISFDVPTTYTTNTNDILVAAGFTPIVTNSVSSLEFTKISPVSKAILKIETPLVGSAWVVTPFLELPDPIPTYSIMPDRLLVNEGEIITFTIVTTDVAVGTELSWTLATTADLDMPNVATANDFSGASSGTFLVNASGMQVVTLQLVNEVYDENNTEVTEVFALNLKTGNINSTDVEAISSTVSIVDKSYVPVPTYTIIPDVTEILESNGGIGGSVLFTVVTTNIDNGTQLTWELDTDFSTAELADFDYDTTFGGTITIQSNVAMFRVNLEPDITSESPNEFFRLILKDSGAVVARSPSITIIDSYEEPIYNIIPNLTTVNEGQTVDFQITAQNVNPSTTPIYWKIDTNDSTVVAGDFTDSKMQGGPLQLVGNLELSSTILSRVVLEDRLTEGTEIFSINIYTDAAMTQLKAASVSVVINDTSRLAVPTYSIVPQLPPGLTINEGGAIPYIVSTTGVADGTPLWWKFIPGGVADPKTTVETLDFSPALDTGTITINNSNSGFGLQTINDEAGELVNEGNEIVTVYLYTDAACLNKVASAATVTIIDPLPVPATYRVLSTLTNPGNVNVGYRFVSNEAHIEPQISESINFGTPLKASWSGTRNGIALGTNVKYRLTNVYAEEILGPNGYPPQNAPCRIKVFSDLRPETYHHEANIIRIPEPFYSQLVSITPINEILGRVYTPNAPVNGLVSAPPINTIKGPNDPVSLFLVFNPFPTTYTGVVTDTGIQMPYNIVDNPLYFRITTTWQYESGDADLAADPVNNTLVVSQTGSMAASNGLNFWDPVAQTFFVNANVYPNGVFIKHIDLFFKKKSDWAPIECQIRPVVNGFPSSSVILPFGNSVKQASEVNVSSDATLATSFEFSNIIHLAPGEYSFVILTNTDEYELYSSKIGEFLLTDPEQRVTTQPLLGSIFKSQNATTWTPFQEEDLKFRLYKCNFVQNTVGTALLNTKYSGPSNIEYELFYSGGETVDFADTTIDYSFRTSTPNPVNGTKVSGDLIRYQSGTNVNLGSTKTLFANDGTSLQLSVDLSTVDRNITPIIDINRLSNVLVKNIINNDDGGELNAYGGNAYSRYITRSVKLNPGFESSDLKVYLNAKIPVESSIKCYYKISTSYDNTFDDNNYTEFELISSDPWIDGKYSEYPYKTPYTTAEIVSVSGTVGTPSTEPTGPWTALITDMTSTAILNVGRQIFATPGVGSLGVDGTYIVTKILNDNIIEFTATGGTTPIAGTISDIRLASSTVDASSRAFANGEKFDTFSVKIVMLSSNPAMVPIIKDLRVIALDD